MYGRSISVRSDNRKESDDLQHSQVSQLIPGGGGIAAVLFHAPSRRIDFPWACSVFMTSHNATLTAALSLTQRLYSLLWAVQ